MRKLLVLLVLITACAPQKPRLNVTAATIDKVIIKGQTTKDDLLKELGPPQNVSKPVSMTPQIKSKDIEIEMPPMTKAKEIWSYWDTTTNFRTGFAQICFLGGLSGSTSVKTTILQIYIDENGVVLDFNFNQSR